MKELVKMGDVEVSIKRGTEGPKHDPYAFDEYRVMIDGKNVVLHTGLASWVKVDDREVVIPMTTEQRMGNEFYTLREKKFEELTGISIDQLEEKIYNEEEECKCGSTDFKDSEGFPGETLLICNVCGSVVNSWFNESAIM